MDVGWKNPGIFDDHFQDIDPMLSNDVEQPDDSHLLAICVEEVEALYGRKIQESDDNNDSEHVCLF